MICPKCVRGGSGPHPKGCTPEMRFWAKVEPVPSGCWEWTGSNAGRYGEMHTPWGKMSAHRLSYEIHNGPIPAGRYVLHRCDNPLCVRPDHLTTGTQADNIADMMAKGRGRLHPRKTHCVHGHAYTPENTRRHKDGYQVCRECTNAPRRKQRVA